ncbi:MAG: lamin tail domain-containing protein [bacterium]
MNSWKFFIGVFTGFFAIFSAPIQSHHQHQKDFFNGYPFLTATINHFDYTASYPGSDKTAAFSKIPTAVYSSDEMIINGGLEIWSSGSAGPPDSWIYGSGLSVEQTSEEVFTGLYAGLVTKLKDGTQTFEQIIASDIAGNANYRLCFHVIDNDGNANNRCRAWIYWASQPGGQGFISNSYTGYSTDTPDWQEISVTATAPENAVSARVRIAFYGDIGVEYYLDEISLIEMEESTPTPNPTETPVPTFPPTNTPTTPPTYTPTVEPTSTSTSIPGSPTATPPPDTPTMTPIPTATPTPTTPSHSPTPTPVPTMPCDHELLWNGDMETWSAGPDSPPDFWLFDNGLSVEQSENPVHGDSFSGKITKLKSGTQFFEQILPYAIKPGSEYRLSYWLIDTDTQPDNRSRAWIYWASEPGGQGFVSNSYSPYSVDEPGWQEISTIAVAPDTAVSARVRIAFYGNTEISYYVDDISLMELCEPTPTPIPTNTPPPTMTPTAGPGTPTFTPAPTSTSGPTATPTAEPTQTSIVINEVHFNPLGNDTGKEFIELLNVSNQPVDLTGYDLKPDTSSYYTFPIFILSPGERVSIRINTDGEDTDNELFTGLTGNMGNSAGFVALFNSSTHSHSTLVDYVAYGAGGQTWESAAVTAGIWTTGDFVDLCEEGRSINLNPDGVDTNISDNWSCCEPTMNSRNCSSAPSPTVTPTSQPGTPTQTPAPTSTPEPRFGVVINEVLFDPSGVDTGKEFVELYNNSSYPITLTGYDLKPDSSTYYTFPAFVLNPHAFVTIHINTSGMDTDTELFTGPATNMGNSAGYIALFNSNTHGVGTIVDYIAYGAGGQTWESTAVSAGIWTAGDFIPISDVDGYSINLCPDGADRDSSINWQISDPSAGRANDCAEPTPTPTITGTPVPTRTPTVTPTPRPPIEPVIKMAGFGNTAYRLNTGGQIQVLAWVTDPENDVENVYLMLGGEIIAELFDDGKHGDFGAGDGIFGITFDLPPVTSGFPEGLLRLQLRIVAYDSRGFDSHIWPLLTVEPGYDFSQTYQSEWWEKSLETSSPKEKSSMALNNPKIFMAGFMDTRIHALTGGWFTMLAFVTGDLPIKTVELYYQGLPTGVLLHDNGKNNDFGAGDNIFGLSVYIGPGIIDPGSYPFQLRATDSEGKRSDLWPYLTISD